MPDSRVLLVDDDVDARVGHGGFDADLRHEIDHVFGAAIELGMAFLAAVALDLGDGDAGDAGVGQRVAHVVELERADDRGDELHVCYAGCTNARPMPAPTRHVPAAASVARARRGRATSNAPPRAASQP